MWCTAEKRFVRHVCLRNPFLPFLLGTATIQPLPEATASCLSLHCSSRKKPVPCREAEGLVTELWSPRYVTILWLCSQLCYETAANQRTLVQIELLATVSWKWGCRPFSCRCSQNVPHCRQEICSTCLFKESIPTIPCVNSKHPIPARSLRFFLRAAACSTNSALCLHHAHPFGAASEKNLSHAEKQRVWSRSCGMEDLLQCSDCAFSCAMWLLQTNERLSRLSF